MPGDYHASVTAGIPLEATAEADGLSTALFLMSQEEGEALLASVSTEGKGIWISAQDRE